MAYFNVLKSDLDQPIMFKFCCEKAIQQMSEMGIKIIKNYKTIVEWNRIFRTNEMFPQPNYYIEMGKSDQHFFLETFPEVKLKLNEWAKSTLEHLNCENIVIQIKQNILPNTYQDYLLDCGLDNHQLFFDDF